MHFNRELTDCSFSFIPQNATKKRPSVLSRKSYSRGGSRWHSTVSSQTNQLYLANYAQNMANYGEFYGVNYVGEVIFTNTPHQMTDQPRFIPGQPAKTR